jgi:hypothetical protein
MSHLNAQYIYPAQAQILQWDRVFSGRTFPQHAPHVVLQLILAIHTVQSRQYCVSSREIIQEIIKREYSGIKHVYNEISEVHKQTERLGFYVQPQMRNLDSPSLTPLDQKPDCSRKCSSRTSFPSLSPSLPTLSLSKTWVHASPQAHNSRDISSHCQFLLLIESKVNKLSRISSLRVGCGIGQR